MNLEYPLISVIMPTFNRAKTIERAIKSVLNQTYTNIEFIIIDDGSTDNTSEILSRFSDHRIVIFRHEKNKGVTAAKNTGLKNIKGEWFSIFDSDDEMFPEAIETMISIPLYFDKNVTAVTCNCLDAADNKLRGKGLTKDQYLDAETIMFTSTFDDSDFWGLTKTSLLMGDSFNENLKGFEDVLWYKIDDRARRYYIHKPLNLVYTEGLDRISNSKYNFNNEIKLYTNLINEEYYLNKLRKYNPVKFNNICRNGLIVTRVIDNKNIALKYFEYLNSYNQNSINKLIFKYWIFAVMMKKLKIIKLMINPKFKFFLKNLNPFQESRVK